MRVLLGLPRWRSPAGAEGRSPGDCPSGQPGVPPDPAAGPPLRAGGLGREVPGVGVGGGDGPVPQPLPTRRLPVPPKKRSREGKGRMLHLRSGKRGDCEEEFLAVDVQRRTAFVGHGSAGDEVHQRC